MKLGLPTGATYHRQVCLNHANNTTVLRCAHVMTVKLISVIAAASCLQLHN